MQLALSLPLRNQAELDQLISELYDEHSPNYHKYLSVEQFTERFGPTQADYQAVIGWAKANGLRITKTTRNRRIIDAEAPVSAINRAFHVVETEYADSASKRTFFAPDREPMTSGLSIALLFAEGLDNYSLPHANAGLSATTASGTGSLNGAYLPGDMRTAYYGTGSLDGEGQTVGIFSFNGYKQEDLDLYFEKTGMVATAQIDNIYVNDSSNGLCGPISVPPASGCGDNSCYDGEQILDIVNVMGMAPKAHILFYEGSLATDVLNAMAADDAAEIISSSWRGGNFSSADPIFQEFAAQGQTFVNASGDKGSFNINPQTNYSPPSVDPYVLQVGGTTLTTGSAGSWSAESGWSSSGGSSGGGYIMYGAGIPFWQQNAITPGNQGSGWWRNSPDVAAEADADNPNVCNGEWSATGWYGTSFAAPRWAGFLALANQQSIANGNGAVGFINPRLYQLGESAFHDIATGSNGFPAVAGYDLVTGLGSPTRALIAQLAGAAADQLFRSGFEASPVPPNLTPYQPAGWSDKIVVSKATGSTTDAEFLLPSDSLYIDWAVINDGNSATTSAIGFDFYLDGEHIQSWQESSPVNPSVYEWVRDWSIGGLSAGPHTLQLVVNYPGAESSSADNSYAKTILVSGPNLTPYQPPGWSDKLVVTSQPGSTVDDAFLQSSQTLYVDWAVINNGTVPTANPFEFYLYIDGVRTDKYWGTSSPLGLPPLYGYVSGFSIGALSAGSHAVKIVADPSNVVPEIDEMDNAYEKTITVH